MAKRTIAAKKIANLFFIGPPYFESYNPVSLYGRFFLSNIETELSEHLPIPNALYRVDKHQNVDSQAVAKPKQKEKIQQQTARDRDTNRQPGRREVSNHHCADVADRIEDAVAEVIQRDGHVTVSPNNKIRIFEEFPATLENDCCNEACSHREPFSSDQP